MALAQETHGAYSMWFNPDVLSKTNTTTPANLANPANYEPKTGIGAPLISKLAKLAEPLDSENRKTADLISKLAKLAEPLDSENRKTADLISKLAKLAGGVVTLSAADRKKILAWLASIGETDQALINETLERCESDQETLAYFLGRAASAQLD